MEEQDRISDISEVISRLEAWAGSYKKSTDDGTTWDAETRIVTNDRDTNMTTEKRKQTVRSWHCPVCHIVQRWEISPCPFCLENEKYKETPR